MLKNFKFVGVGFLLFLGFTMVSFQPGFRIVETAWSETNTLSDSHKNDPEIKDAQSWGAFRGWSPSVPYGEKSSDQTNILNSDNSPPMDEKFLTNRDEAKPDEPSRTDNSSINQEVDESLGAFRGWSPAVPYGN